MNKIVMVLEKDLVFPILDRRVYKEALSLIKKGYEVVVITWAMRMNQKKFAKIYSCDGIKVIRLFQDVVPPQKSNYLKLMPFIKLFFKTFFLINKHKPDYLHCHDAFPLLSCYLYSAFHKNKLIYDSHELNPYRDEPKLFLHVFKFFEVISFKRIDCIITANFVRQQFMKSNYNYDKKYIFIENTPYEDKNNTFIDKSKEQAIKLIYQGGISAQRGIDKIIQAMSELKIENFYLSLYGPYYPDKSKYEELIKKNKLEDCITLNDSVSIEQLELIMKENDIGIVSVQNTSLNNYYCAPNKLYDYMKAKMVILGPDFPHMKEIIEDNNIGFTCDFEDIESIKNAFLQIIENIGKFTEMKNNSYILHKSNYNWSLEEKKLLQMYEDV